MLLTSSHLICEFEDLSETVTRHMTGYITRQHLSLHVVCSILTMWNMCAYAAGWVSTWCLQVRGGAVSSMNVGVDWAVMQLAEGTG